MSTSPTDEVTKTIALSRGLFCMVDAEDFEYLSQWKWYARTGDSDGFYASRATYTPSEDGKRKQSVIQMHRLLTNAKPGQVVDHINGNTLDNRKRNLRACAHAENIRNMRKRPNLTSPFKGVSFHKQSGKWQASIKTDYKQKWLGNFEDPIQAALAYNAAAIEQHGQFARINEL